VVKASIASQAISMEGHRPESRENFFAVFAFLFRFFFFFSISDRAPFFDDVVEGVRIEAKRRRAIEF